jgi:hypothetical protein
MHLWQIKLTIVESVRRHLLENCCSSSLFFFYVIVFTHVQRCANIPMASHSDAICNCLYYFLTNVVKLFAFMMLCSQPQLQPVMLCSQPQLQPVKLAWFAKAEYRDTLRIVALGLRRCKKLQYTQYGSICISVWFCAALLLLKKVVIYFVYISYEPEISICGPTIPLKPLM